MQSLCSGVLSLSIVSIDIHVGAYASMPSYAGPDVDVAYTSSECEGSEHNSDLVYLVIS